MKKSLFAIAVIGISVCCLGACKNADNAKYDALNAMLDASYSKLEITVTDKFDEDTTLTSVYTINYSASQITVEYTVERFVELSLDGSLSGNKMTLVGEAVIKDGEISISGDDVGVTAAIARPQLTFKKDYFENTQLTGSYLIADVKNASEFLGSQTDCTDMKVKAIFLEVFYDIEISYISEVGSEVKYTYEFKI